MRWWLVLLLAGCSTQNWGDGKNEELQGGWAHLTLPSQQGTPKREDPDHLIMEYEDGGSAKRQRLFKSWHATLVRSGWKPVETSGNLSTGKVKRANFHGVDETRRGLLEVTVNGDTVRVSVRKTTPRAGWDPA